MSELVYDIEATGFLDDSNVDYTASPWKLKDHFKIHCIALEEKTVNNKKVEEVYKHAKEAAKKYEQF